MIIKLLSNWTDKNNKVWTEKSRMLVTNDLGNDLIEKGIAKEINDMPNPYKPIKTKHKK